MIPYGTLALPPTVGRCDVCQGRCWVNWTDPQGRVSRVQCPYCHGAGTNAWRDYEADHQERKSKTNRRLLFWWAVLQIPVSIVVGALFGLVEPMALDTFWLFGDFAAIVALIYLFITKPRVGNFSSGTEVAVVAGVAAAGLYAIGHHHRPTPPPVQQAVRNVMGH